MNDNRRFEKGSGKYKCADCGKTTRETGHGESDCGLCYRCMQNAEIENYVNDNNDTELMALKDANPSMDWVDIYAMLDEKRQKEIGA